MAKETPAPACGPAAITDEAVARRLGRVLFASARRRSGGWATRGRASGTLALGEAGRGRGRRRRRGARHSISLCSTRNRTRQVGSITRQSGELSVDVCPHGFERLHMVVLILIALGRVSVRQCEPPCCLHDDFPQPIPPVSIGPGTQITGSPSYKHPQPPPRPPRLQPAPLGPSCRPQALFKRPRRSSTTSSTVSTPTSLLPRRFAAHPPSTDVVPADFDDPNLAEDAEYIGMARTILDHTRPTHFALQRMTRRIPRFGPPSLIPTTPTCPARPPVLGSSASSGQYLSPV